LNDSGIPGSGWFSPFTLASQSFERENTLQEKDSGKSDDVVGRSKVYEAIVKGENPPEPGIPESFNVLMKELQALCLDVQLEQAK